MRGLCGEERTSSVLPMPGTASTAFRRTGPTSACDHASIKMHLFAKAYTTSKTPLAGSVVAFSIASTYRPT